MEAAFAVVDDNTQTKAHKEMTYHGAETCTQQRMKFLRI
jgi:hypothetical protein